jgi:hypothetical protein
MICQFLTPAKQLTHIALQSSISYYHRGANIELDSGRQDMDRRNDVNYAFPSQLKHQKMMAQA